MKYILDFLLNHIEKSMLRLAVFMKWEGVVKTPAYTPVSPEIIPETINATTLPTTPLQSQSGAPSAVSTATKDMLTVFCSAIRDFEGKPGDLNYINNNPGNCRCSEIGYLPMYGDVKCVLTGSGYFAKFPTPELGWLYLTNLVHFRAGKHPEWTILDFFNNYAPVADKNSPNIYAANVAKKCGVIPTTKLKDLFA